MTQHDEQWKRTMSCDGCEKRDSEIKRLKRLCWDLWADLDEVATVVVHSSQRLRSVAHQLADETMRSFLRERGGDEHEG